MNCFYISVPQGCIQIQSKDCVIQRVELCSHNDPPYPTTIPQELSGFGDQLEEYFAGQRKDLTLPPLNWENCTEFQRSVLQALQTVGYGMVVSYSYLAWLIGVPSPRAVGQALGANPFPVLLPCHRVVGKDGALTGFGSGLAWKEALLSIEGRMVHKGYLSLQEDDAMHVLSK